MLDKKQNATLVSTFNSLNGFILKEEKVKWKKKLNKKFEGLH
jgi:hypothetical protein